MEELKHIARIRKRPGQSIFSLNIQTGEIKIVEGKKIIIEPNCIYRQALNRKNFIRKLFKEGILREMPKSDLRPESPQNPTDGRPESPVQASPKSQD